VRSPWTLAIIGSTEKGIVASAQHGHIRGSKEGNCERSGDDSLLAAAHYAGVLQIGCLGVLGSARNIEESMDSQNRFQLRIIFERGGQVFQTLTRYLCSELSKLGKSRSSLLKLWRRAYPSGKGKEKKRGRAQAAWMNSSSAGPSTWSEESALPPLCRSREGGSDHWPLG